MKCDHNCNSIESESRSSIEFSQLIMVKFFPHITQLFTFYPMTHMSIKDSTCVMLKLV